MGLVNNCTGKLRLACVLGLGLALAASAPRAAEASIALVQEVGSAESYGYGFPDGQLWIELGTTVQAGNRVIVSFSMEAQSGFVTCTDGMNNTYVVDADVTTGSGSSGVRTVVFSAYIDTSLAPLDKILVILPETSAARAMTATEFSGLSRNAFAYDQTATDGATSGTTLSAGPTGTTAWTSELVFGAFGAQGVRAFTGGGGYNALTEIATSGAGSDPNVSVFSEYLLASGTGAFTATADMDLSGSWAGAVVTYSDPCGSLTVDPGATCDADATDTSLIQVRKNNQPNRDSWQVSAVVYYPPSSLVADVLAGGLGVAIDLQNGTFASPVATYDFAAADCKAKGTGGLKCRAGDGSTLTGSPRNGAFRVTARVRNQSLAVPAPASTLLGMDSLFTMHDSNTQLPGTVRPCDYRNKGATMLCRQTN